MKISVIYIKALIIIGILFGCSSKKVIEKFEIIGNWSVISDSIYYEYYFSKDTLEFFNYDWQFYPPAIYRIEKDRLYIQNLSSDSSEKIGYRIKLIDSENLRLINSNKEIILKKIPNKEFTIEKLIKDNYFMIDHDNPQSEYMLASFADSNFRIREFNFLFENNILNKDTIINFWNTLIKDSTIDNSYLEYLIENIE